MTELKRLYQHFFGVEPERVELLGGAASNRRYFRMYGPQTAIGVIGENAKENHAFIALARHMKAQSLPVPELYAVSADEMRYVQADCGHESLYDVLRRDPESPATHALLHEVMRLLPRLQFRTAEGFDFLHDAFREPRFSLTTVRWDLNYFKYCFLKLTGYPMDELRLEDEFERITAALLDETDQHERWAFLYRDFQSRNVMVNAEGQPSFIDFQGGYEGPVYYDVASFLWQTRAGYPAALRDELIATYVDALQEFEHIDLARFKERLQVFVLFRLLQTLGTYGYRGLFEHKAMFQTPISQALQALVELTCGEVGRLCPYLSQVLADVAQMERFQPHPAEGPLTVRVTSFSYKKGIPEDLSGNGGGFVFDCRAPLNPGRFAFYKKLTGLDAEVIDFLEGRRDEAGQLIPDPTGQPTSMQTFVVNAARLVDPAVQTYLDRGFTSLVVNCGCTGGQHRSVYCAQHLAEHLHERFPQAHIVLVHREQHIHQDF